MRARRIGLSLLAPAAAIVLSLIISSLALWASGNNPFHAYNVMIHFFLWFCLVPTKMVLRWTVNLKYIIGIPEFFFNV